MRSPERRLVRVKLRGPLRAHYDGEIEVYAATAAEAIEIAVSQIPGLQPDATGRKRVRIGGHNTQQDLYKPLEVDELHVFPQVSGGKNNGLVQILVAAIIIAVLVIFGPPGGIAAAMSAPFASFPNFIVFAAVMTAINLTIGGLIQMLAEQPKLDKGEERSGYLGVPGTTVEIGTPIRVIYGTRKVGFHVLSFYINAGSRSSQPQFVGGSGSGGGAGGNGNTVEQGLIKLYV